MRKKVLLLDGSLTVQKVVALTLDKEQYSVAYAKTRAEAVKTISESRPDVILVSDQVSDLDISAFPNEVEALCNRYSTRPPLVLIASHKPDHSHRYDGVLGKPFSPQALKDVIKKFVTSSERRPEQTEDASGEQALQDAFSNTFSDEQKLVRETLVEEIEQEERTLLTIPAPLHGPGTQDADRADSIAQLWGTAHVARGTTLSGGDGPKTSPSVLSAAESVAYKAALESQVAQYLSTQDLEQLVRTALANILPSIVERLAQERLDKLLAEQQKFVSLKPGN